MKDNCFTEFCCFLQTSTWISHRYTYIPSLLNLPPHLLPHLTPLDWYRAPVWVCFGLLNRFFFWCVWVWFGESSEWMEIMGAGCINQGGHWAMEDEWDRESKGEEKSELVPKVSQSGWLLYLRLASLVTQNRCWGKEVSPVTASSLPYVLMGWFWEPHSTVSESWEGEGWGWGSREEGKESGLVGGKQTPPAAAACGAGQNQSHPRFQGA